MAGRLEDHVARLVGPIAGEGNVAFAALVAVAVDAGAPVYDSVTIVLAVVREWGQGQPYTLESMIRIVAEIRRRAETVAAVL